MIVRSDNHTQSIFDRHYALKCPHCGVQSNISAVSIPRYEFVFRFKPTKVGIVYRCDSCNAPVFLRFSIEHEFGNSRFIVDERYEEIELPRRRSNSSISRNLWKPTSVKPWSVIPTALITGSPRCAGAQSNRPPPT